MSIPLGAGASASNLHKVFSNISDPKSQSSGSTGASVVLEAVRQLGRGLTLAVKAPQKSSKLCAFVSGVSKLLGRLGGMLGTGLNWVGETLVNLVNSRVAADSDPRRRSVGPSSSGQTSSVDGAANDGHRTEFISTEAPNSTTIEPFSETPLLDRAGLRRYGQFDESYWKNKTIQDALKEAESEEEEGSFSDGFSPDGLGSLGSYFDSSSSDSSDSVASSPSGSPPGSPSNQSVVKLPRSILKKPQIGLPTDSECKSVTINPEVRFNPKVQVGEFHPYLGGINTKYNRLK